jgi:hypothetical protein
MKRLLRLLIIILLPIVFYGCGNGATRPTALLNPTDIFPKDPYAATKIEKGWTVSNRPSEYNQFYIAEYCAATSENNDNNEEFCKIKNDKQVIKYIRQGIALSDTVCERWFDVLIETQANTEFLKDNVAILGGGAITIMGALRSAAKEIAVVGALFSGVNAGFDNFQAAFLFTPDMHIIEKKIEAVREKAAEHIRGESEKYGIQGQPKYYEDAKDRLLAYHNICSGAEIKRLIEESVVQRKYEFRPDGINWTIPTAEIVSPGEAKARLAAEKEARDKEEAAVAARALAKANELKRLREETAAKAEIEKAKAEAAKANAAAEKSKADGERAKVEVEKIKAEAEKIKADAAAEKTKAQAEKTKAEAEKIKKEAEQVKTLN